MVALRDPPHPHPPLNGLGSRPPSVVWVVVGLIGNPPPPSPLWCGVLWVGVPLAPYPPVVWGPVGGNPPPSPLWCGVWWSRVRAGKSWWGPSRVGSPGGREASLVRQTKFCGRRFCFETLGCPSRCFGRPWRFLLGTIQNRVIKSVLMTSRPPTIDYTLCHILYTIYSRVYTIYYRLYSVYMQMAVTRNRGLSRSSPPSVTYLCRRPSVTNPCRGPLCRVL